MTLFIYRLSEAYLGDFRKFTSTEKTGYELESGIGQCVKAALEIKSKLTDYREWDGSGEYWFATLPGLRERVVICRPDSNPFAEGIAVSPVELPYLTPHHPEE